MGMLFTLPIFKHCSSSGEQADRKAQTTPRQLQKICFPLEQCWPPASLIILSSSPARPNRDESPLRQVQDQKVLEMVNLDIRICKCRQKQKIVEMAAPKSK